ncbi:DUF3247 family protein [Lysobacter sp. TY2-98]|uniref:DUF3247 family protein n=1 Tax=Lysobacter sp. TY2-98 TaxID=2290922 RepID=UPI0013B369BD|nr:DUF3247 family protein [Lysobacter sp. TY2-98]
MRIAPRVYTAQPDIDRLQAIALELPNDEHVQVTLDDGRVFTGIVAARPITQQFYDANGDEGTNGAVRLEQSALEHPEDARWVDLYLDQIVEVRHLDRDEPGARHPLHSANNGPWSRSG